MAKFSKNIGWRSNPADNLTDDVLVEILSRVPYKSMCRFKCVSRRWRGIISDPVHRKVLGKYHLGGLAGFIQSSRRPDRSGPIYHYTRFPEGSLPNESLPFLRNHRMFTVLDSCNGLLLCSCLETNSVTSFNYVVCNPTTEKWVVLPGSFDKMLPARLGFEPAVSSHFHVFQFEKNGVPTVYNGDVDNNDYDNSHEHIKGVDIYSSKTGVWTHKQNRLDRSFSIVSDLRSVFVNGVLFLVASGSALVTVDVEGNTWKMIPMPEIYNIGSIDLSQGSIYLAYTTCSYDSELSISVLEDRGSSEEWILKYTIEYFNLFGVHIRPDYSIVAMHPERDTIYLVYGKGKVLISYDMDSKKVCFIQSLAHDSTTPYYPYAPLYCESLDGHWQSDSKSRPSLSAALSAENYPHVSAWY